MNLYSVLVEHLSQKDSHQSIQGYFIAKDDSEAYDIVNQGYAYWYEKDLENFLENHYPDFDEVKIPDYDRERFLENFMKEFIISTKGEINSDWANYDDLYYGKTHYGWELVKESMENMEIEVLRFCNIIN
jgi:hypothetical protein